MKKWKMIRKRNKFFAGAGNPHYQAEIWKLRWQMIITILPIIFMKFVYIRNDEHTNNPSTVIAT